ncbi:MAG: repeat protein [Myxococcaceae bacterium]|nr:repeat protein [Myxococcaceae bacterium]
MPAGRATQRSGAEARYSAGVSKRNARLWLSLWSLLAPVARAQPLDDDWSLSRQRAPAERAPVRRARSTPEAPASDPAARARRERALLADPASDYALEQLRTWSLAQDGSLDLAIERLRTASAGRSGALAPRLALARVLVSAGRVDEGLHLLEQVAQEAASGGERRAARALHARVLSGLDRHQEAAAQLLALGADASVAPRARATWLRDAAREQLAASAPDAALLAVQRARELGGAPFAVELLALERQAMQQAGRLDELADSLLQKGELREAARVREQLGDTAGAIAAERAQLARTPSDHSLRADLARLLQQAGQLEQAQREAAELVRRAPQDASYLVQWAELARATGARGSALARLSAASARQPRATGLHRALRALYLRWGESALAERELRVLLTLEPSEPEHRLALADQALARGDRAGALNVLAKLRMPGAPATAEASLAAVLAERDLLPEAIEHAQRAVALAPMAIEPRRVLASLLERGGRTVDAEQAFRDVLARTDPNSPAGLAAREHLVGLWRRAGTDRGHLAELEAKLQQEPLDLEVARTLLALYARIPERRARQAALLQRLLTQAPDDPTLLVSLSRVQLEQGEIGAALATRERLLQRASADPGERVQAGRDALELALGYPRDAAVPSLVVRALALTPREPALQRLAGEVYRQRQDFELARAAYERALALDPRDLSARYALAEDALRRGDRPRAEPLLQAIVEAGQDPQLVTEAAALLLQANPARAEQALLGALQPGEGRSAKLHLLLQYYARTALPLAEALLAGGALDSQRAQLQQTVEHALAALLQALDSSVQAEREVALTLLAAVPVPGAVPALLARAEQPDAAASERALSLVALGGARDARSLARLDALHAQAGRQLRPFLLWALAVGSPELATRKLHAGCADRDPAVRGMAALALALRVDEDSTQQLRALLADPVPAVHMAALWALARREPGQHEAELTVALEQPAPLALVALAASSARTELLVPALFAQDAARRELSASLLTRTPGGAVRLPTPRWPLELTQYVQQASSPDRVAGPAELRADAWPVIERLVMAQLRSPADDPGLVRVLSALSAYEGGLAPTALLSSGACVPAEQARALARHAQAGLASVLADARHSAGARLRAQSLLILGGGAARPEIAAALRQGTPAVSRVMLEELARLPALPEALRPEVQALLVRSPDWPTRMWAARALRLDAAQLAHEPFALVRSAARFRVPTPASQEACSAAARVTN